jgi:DNA polymerase I-like protein with 3'-5' exonuclease and polymerase domains
MLVSFDTEFSYWHGHWRGARFHGDVTTLYPVCACLAYEDGTVLRVHDRWNELASILTDPQHTFLVHGCHAELQFCRRVRLPFPRRFVDTALMSVMLLHSTAFEHGDRVYREAALARMAARYGVLCFSEEDNDEIRLSILRGTYLRDYGMERVLDYCLSDARACLQLYEHLCDHFLKACGPQAWNNLVELYQPYALLMAEVANKGLRFDGNAWDRALAVAPRYRQRLLAQMRESGYDHDGEGLGPRGFQKMISSLGLGRVWPRTPTGEFSRKDDHLKSFRDIPAIAATYGLMQFDKFVAQEIGSLVDGDGMLRCSILPLAQRTGRNSTVQPNLMGIPAALRPVLLADEGCKLVLFDYTQQEPGIAGYLSQDKALLRDFSHGDVYINLGLRMGLLAPNTPPAEAHRVRNGLLKALLLSIIYGKTAYGIACNLQCPLQTARLHLQLFGQTYPRLLAWLKSYVAAGVERGWAENIIGYRAAFDVAEPRVRNHIVRSCQNFPIQASAATCFQLTGLYLADMNADIRLPMHDAYLLSVPDDPEALRQAHGQISAAVNEATHQLFPGLAVRLEIAELARFAKDGHEDSFNQWLFALETEKEEQCFVEI